MVTTPILSLSCGKLIWHIFIQCSSDLRQRINQVAVQYQMDCLDVLTPDQQTKLAETATGGHRSNGIKRP